MNRPHKSKSKKRVQPKEKRFAEILSPPDYDPASLFRSGDAGGWWDASDRTTLRNERGTEVRKSGERIARWLDKSPNHNHLSRAGEGPLYQEQAGVRFDDASAMMYGPAIGMFESGCCSIFVALRAEPKPGSILCGETSSTNDGIIYSLLRSANQEPSSCTSLVRNSANQALAAATQHARVFDNSTKVYSVVDSGKEITGYRDGVAGASGVYARIGSFEGIDRFSLGGLVRRSPTGFFSMNLMEIIVVGRDTREDERKAVEVYLSQKWIAMT